ncbi:hypothetical protein P8935_11390 [Telmatobacter sp. DSM 110680]|uniref:Lipoprotein n=1 Tax=Telmatobacter sp. DSM 110680 TaxID=3036704 RepID=A0AAU7DP25_9BACT
MTARSTGFFQWFHLVQTEQAREEPGQLTRFRPEGKKFHELCYLDVLEASDGAMVQMELVVSRLFIEGTNRLFAQDLVKSFLIAALPDACQHLLADFMREINTPGARGITPGSLVLAGQRDAWATQTGWSRLALNNVTHDNERVFVVRVCPNPEAPNATLVGGKSSHMRKLLALFGLTMSLLACHKPPIQPEVSLKGTWDMTSQQISNCGKPVPVRIERINFTVQDAPLLNRAESSFDFQKANVTGSVSMALHLEGAHPGMADSGILVGEIVKDSAAGEAGTRLQGYILSEAEYGAWVAKNKQGFPPTDAGEVDLAIQGNAAQGYTLNGEIRSSEACATYTHLDAVAGDLTGHFGRSVPAEWSAKVLLQKK